MHRKGEAENKIRFVRIEKIVLRVRSFPYREINLIIYKISIGSVRKSVFHVRLPSLLLALLRAIFFYGEIRARRYVDVSVFK